MANKNLAKYEKEKMAKAVLRAEEISTKQSIEICNFIKKRKVMDAIKMLEDVIKEKRAVPFKRFTEGAGHKKGIGAGKYPKKAASAFIRLLKSAEANAQNKGLSTADLVITCIYSNKAPTQWHYGRKRRRKMKRTHIEVYVEEAKTPENKKNKKEEIKKDDKPANPKKTGQEKKPGSAAKENKQEVVKKEK